MTIRKNVVYLLRLLFQKVVATVKMKKGKSSELQREERIEKPSTSHKINDNCWVSW